jgi:hypothetical protein
MQLSTTTKVMNALQLYGVAIERFREVSTERFSEASI